MTEAPEIRRKRLRIRAWRRGTREMDLILGAFADRELGALDEAEVAAFDALLGENDHDLYQWLTGQTEPPDAHAPLVARIGAAGADTAD